MIRTDARGRRHYIFNEEELPGVTTLLGFREKPFLVPWSAKVTAEVAWELKTDDRPQKAWIDECKKRSQIQRSSAAEFGRQAHEYLQHIFGDTELKVKDLPEEYRPYVRAAKSFIKGSSDQVVATELAVLNSEIGYAGTLDALIQRPNGKTWILDWKTGARVYQDFAVQLLAYAACDHHFDPELEDFVPGWPEAVPDGITGVGCVHLKSDGTWELHALEVTSERLKAARKLLKAIVKARQCYYDTDETLTFTVTRKGASGEQES